VISLFGFIGQVQGFHNVGSPISPSMDDPPETDEISAGNHLIDSVYLFEPLQDLELIPINLTQNMIYYISFESYVPYDPFFTIDVRMQSPTEHEYYFFEDTTELYLNESFWYFEYGAAETGEHILKVLIETSANLTLHILVKEALDLTTYYSRNQFDGIVPENISISEIRQYGMAYLTTQYTFLMRDDTEYIFNFFRVNILNYKARQFIGYTNPTVKLDLTLDGTPFVIYPEIQTQNYSLATNVDHMGEVELWNAETEIFLPDLLDHPLFHVRFGSFTTANATLMLTFDYPDNYLFFNMNFAFMVYTTGNGKIGDGPDDILPVTLPPITDTTSDHLYNDSAPAISLLDKAIFVVQSFLARYFDQTLLVLGGLLVVSITGGKMLLTTRLKKENRGNTITTTERPREDI
jgi:hypothetical protein